MGWGSGSRFNRIHLVSNCWSLVNHQPTRPIISRGATLTCWKRQYTGHFKDVWRPLSTDKQSNRQAHLGRWKRYYHLKRVFHLVYFRRVSLGYMRENYARLDEVLTESYLIGKWGNGDVDQRKFTNSWGRFLWRRTRKKPQKLLMIPGGTSFLFRSEVFFYSFGWSFGRSSVGELREFGSRPLLHLVAIYHHYSIYQFLIYRCSIYSTSMWLLNFTFHWHFETLKKEKG